MLLKWHSTWEREWPSIPISKFISNRLKPVDKYSTWWANGFLLWTLSLLYVSVWAALCWSRAAVFNDTKAEEIFFSMCWLYIHSCMCANPFLQFWLSYFSLFQEISATATVNLIRTLRSEAMFLLAKQLNTKMISRSAKLWLHSFCLWSLDRVLLECSTCLAKLLRLHKAKQNHSRWHVQR